MLQVELVECLLEDKKFQVLVLPIKYNLLPLHQQEIATDFTDTLSASKLAMAGMSNQTRGVIGGGDTDSPETGDHNYN